MEKQKEAPTAQLAFQFLGGICTLFFLFFFFFFPLDVAVMERE